MSVRSRMSMRMVIERSAKTGEDEDGHPIIAWSPWATVPCYAWSQSRKELVDGNKTVVIEDLRALVPLATDLTESDRVARIEDRLERTLFAGSLRIEAVQRMPRHQELMLEKIT